MKHFTAPRSPAFTLIEVLVAATIIVIMVGFMLAVADQTSRIMRNTTGKIEQFREARQGFERMTTRLSQATLNTYWDYNNATTPTRYERRSELRFISGNARVLLTDIGTRRRVNHCIFFNAPFGLTQTDAYRGLENLLNVWGYYNEFDSDLAYRPAFITAALIPLKYRWRLMEFSQTTENFDVYNYTNGATNGFPNSTIYKGLSWFSTDMSSASAPTRVLAENVIALIITPRLSKTEETPLQGGNPDLSPLAPNYSYDSTVSNANPLLNSLNQLPPVVQVTMVAIDEKSAERLQIDPTKWDLFGLSTMFQNTANFTADLSLASSQTNSLEKQLVGLKAQYRIFTTNVHIRGAKWSQDQKN